MPAHPIWKGYLKLSLVTCGVALYPATTQTAKIHFHKLNAKTGNRLRMHMVDEETGEEVPSDEQARGYEIAKGENIVIEKAELENLALESTRTIDIATFVSRADIDPLYFDKAYFVAPEDAPSREAFEVIRHAMAAKKVAALSSIVLHDREHVLLLDARDGGMTATMLHYAYEMRDGTAILGTDAPKKIDGELLEIAETLIDRKRGKFDPSQFTDRYEDALKELVNARQSGHKAQAPKRPEITGARGLMEALKASLAGGVEKSGKAAVKKTAKKKAEPAAREASPKAAKSPPSAGTQVASRARSKA